MQEEWKRIDEFQNYSVSNMGRVRRDEDYKILAIAKGSNGGGVVGFTKNNKLWKRYLPLLVAKAFVPNRRAHEKFCRFDTPLHLDGDKMNACADNLVWSTRSGAIMHHKNLEGR